jgi:hypothetical protein
MLKIYLAHTPENKISAANIAQMIVAANYELVEDEMSADIVIEVRSPGERPQSTATYNVQTAKDSAFGNNARVNNIGDVNAGNFVFESEQTIQGDMTLNTLFDDAKQQVNQSRGLSDKDKETLDGLLDMLRTGLQREGQKDSGNQEAASEMAKQAARIAEEAAKDTPAWHNIKIEAEGLVAAAKNLAVATPYVLPIAQQILTFAARYTG